MISSILVLAALNCPSPPSDVSIEFGPRPEWIEAVELEIAPSPAPGSHLVEWILVDVQDRVAVGHDAKFVRIAKRVLSEQGLQSESQVEINFDPSYATLTIHDVVIHRDGETFDRLREDQFSILRREEALERQIFDGQHTAIAVLEDIRVGDTVEISYTTIGRSPLFANNYVSRHSLGFFDPIGRFRHTIAIENGRELSVRTLGGETEPKITRTGTTTKYLWDNSRVPGTTVDGDLPAWFEPVPWVQVSEFESWATVATWATELFVFDQPSDQVHEFAEHIKARTADPEKRALLALRHVQDDVRYVAIELGVSSFQPNSPEVVLQRRFGDCKDQALLLVHVLRELGISAQPALVNTIYGRLLPDQLPDPTSFDHAIVHATVAGRDVWMDPTRDEVGPLDEFGLLNYEYALLVGRDQTELTPVIRDEGIKPSVFAGQNLHLDDRGAGQFECVTTYRGEAANTIRSIRGWVGDEGFGANALDYLRNFYPNLKQSKPIRFEDLPDQNELVVYEEYVIPQFFDAEGENGPTGVFHAIDLFSVVTDPTKRERKAPLALQYPTDVRMEITARLPGNDWEKSGDSHRINNASFKFEFDESLDSGLLRIVYAFETHRDHVPAAEFGAYLKDLDVVSSHLSRELWRAEPVFAGRGAFAGAEPGSQLSEQTLSRIVNGLALFIVLVFAGVGYAITAFRRRRSSGPAYVRDHSEEAPGTERPIAARRRKAPPVWREGRLLVMDAEARLPRRCIHCNEYADHGVKRKLTYTPKYLLVLLLAPVFYILAAVLIQKRQKLTVGLCDQHFQAYRKRVRRGAAIAFTGLALIAAGGLLLASNTSADGATGVSVSLLISGFCVALFGAYLHSNANILLTAVYLDDRVLELKGAAPEFLDSFHRRVA